MSGIGFIGGIILYWVAVYYGLPLLGLLLKFLAIVLWEALRFVSKCLLWVLIHIGKGMIWVCVQAGRGIHFTSLLLYFLMIEALRLGEAATVVPFKYSGLVWGLLLGFLVWRHVPNAWMLVGAALVAGSGLYLLRLEFRPAPRRLGQSSGADRGGRAG